MTYTLIYIRGRPKRVSFDGKNIEPEDFETVRKQIASKRLLVPERPPACVRSCGFFEKVSGPAFSKAIIEELEAPPQGPVNQIEGAIIMIQIGCASVVQLLAALALAPIGTLLNSQQDPAILTLRHLDGTPRVAVFTESHRAAKATEKYPGYRWILRGSGKELVDGLAERVGLVINPFEKVVGYDLSPLQTRTLKDFKLSEVT